MKKAHRIIKQAKLSNATELDLSNLNLTKLTPKILDSLVNVQTLNLSGNKLTHLPKAIFKTLIYSYDGT